MQLDHARIAIRERGYLDLLDLAVLVVRHHPLGLVAAAAVGAVPFALLDRWLVSNDPDRLPWYFGAVLLEIPLATAPLTLYLGQVLFRDRPSTRRIARELLGSLVPLLVYQVLLRGILEACVVTVPILWIQFGFLNEIILLERDPWTRVWKRARDLHQGEGGAVFGQALAALFFGVVFVTCFWQALTTVSQVMVHRLTAVNLDVASVLDSWPAQVGLWIAICYFGLVRFLAYLNLRIRHEGWEIELRMRALGARLGRRP